jgi:hypothetical protein
MAVPSRRHAFSPRPRPPPAPTPAICVSMAVVVGIQNPVPWTGRGAAAQGPSFRPAETRSAIHAILERRECHYVTGFAARRTGESASIPAEPMRTVTASTLELAPVQCSLSPHAKPSVRILRSLQPRDYSINSLGSSFLRVIVQDVARVWPRPISSHICTTTDGFR